MVKKLMIFKKKKNNIRLSKYVIPDKYDIQLHPDLENFTFEGIETIHLSILKQTKSLTLHSKNLEIETVKIQGKTLNNTPQDIFADKITYNEKDETVTLLFKKFIPKEKNVKITLVFKGILNEEMRGFYKSSYNIDGKIHHMATTQFEATDARRAFPCFDEPSQKAIFNVSLIIPKGKTAISNTLPISVLEHSAGYEIVKFHPTPKMSSYLLAFIVGDFEYIEQKYTPTPLAFGHSPSGRGRSVRVRVYTTPGKIHQARFALDTTVKMLEFYEEYFDIVYPLDTLDLIAIPDFASGAMENWGAITYRESVILIDENHSSLSNKQWVALVIAHELAHQWFGNLVTMEWWTHLWLNEGFASYIEYLAVDKLFPKWDIWTQFSTNDLGVALRLDSLYHTHPVEVEVHHPNEIGQIFDEVSYSKGASIIRMLAEYLGEKDFRNGLRYYLKKHSYKNTETIHLWEAFEKISKKPVASIMHNWTNKGGYPVVNIDMVKNKLIFSQKRFFISPISEKKSLKTKGNNLWKIPISFSSENKITKFTLSTKNKVLLLKDPMPKWVKVNIGESGFYRSHYSDELLNKLAPLILNKYLSSRDRLGILRDLFALSERGIISTIKVLEFLKSYKNEDNYTVWLEIATGLSHLEQILVKIPDEDKLPIHPKENLNKFILDLFSPIFTSLGWEKKEKEAHTDSLLRSLVISRLGFSGDQEVINKAKYLFSRIKEGFILHPDIRSAIYGIIVNQGDAKEYKNIIEMYKKETLHEEKNRLGYALGNFRDQKILELVCNFTMSPYVRNQDTVSIITGVGSNPYGRDVWWNFVRNNWDTLVLRYGNSGHQLSRLVKAIDRSAEKKHLISFKSFFKINKAPGASRAIEQVKE
ncbi:MAG: M1 family metallopeptidase, partial [Patescibacteria group bacterium]